MGDLRGSPAAYDAIADWYAGYIAGPAAPFGQRADLVLRRVLGPGEGPCWDLACGTAVHAATMGELGWTPIGSDVSRGQLRHASHIMPTVLADAGQLPVRPGSLPAVASVLCHTDVDDYATVCRSAAAALRPAGRFAHVGVHPCFVGPFIEPDGSRLVVNPGYWTTGRTRAGSPGGVRDRVGTVHIGVAGLLRAVIDAGLVVTDVYEAGDPTPDVLGLAAYKPEPEHRRRPTRPHVDTTAV
jgi:SAM-dependent methyltransferase